MMDGSIRASFGYIPSGVAGVKSTLQLMGGAVRRFLKPKNQERTNALLAVRMLAQNLVLNCQEKDYWGEAEALQQFVRDAIRYTRDMRTSELLQTPDKTLEFGSGDCDDKAMLYCALAECIGFDTRFCAIAVDEDNFSHVCAQVLIPRCGWVNAETIPIDERGTKVPLGWFPPDCTCLMLYHI